VLSDVQVLAELGYSPHWEALFESHVATGLVPARMVRSDRGSALVATLQGVVRATPSTGLLKSAQGPADLPVVGDWVALAEQDPTTPLIEVILERNNAITRGDPGKRSELQVLAANIDTVFVVHPIAEPPNLRRIERELSLAWDSGAIPIVVLTKADLSPDAETARSTVESIAIGVDVLLVNALRHDSAERLCPHISAHHTAILIGPSGAGKSTLINVLLREDRQATREVRVGDGRGRHTTVVRELIKIAGHGVLIDTPGLRALGLTGSEEGIAATFPDIESLAQSCHFRDCSHSSEPNCAVQSAVESGTLPLERLESYHKLLREARFAAMKTDARLRAEEDRKWKSIAKAARDYHKRRGRG